MCGICGQLNFKTRAPASRETIVRMTNTLVHRGPDDDGYYFSGPLAFGFRRLSIIDLSGGHQPMSDREETIWVVFNGEIFNFPELRSELETHGHVFQTRSDTEVIIHGYKQWGADVFNHLNGMFGVAVWDEAEKRLLVARDAMGIKMIYYRLDGDGLTFGSELRPILASGIEKPEVDPVALNLFLRYRFTPSPLTLHKGIRKLAPGTMLVCEKGECREVRWYTYKPEPFSPMPSDEEAREELLAIYKRAVKRHLLSDVPVGLLLSGGVDSGLLLGLMGLEGKDWPTFTVGYGTSFKDDELKDAAETARIFGAHHTPVELTREIFEEALPNIVASLEEPVATSSIVPMYFVCRRARQDVKVALVGQGPDELFGGYKRHLGVRYGGLWAGLPGWMRSGISAGINMLPRNETLKRGVYSLDVPDRMRRYQNVLSLAPGDQVDALFHDGLLPPDAGDKVLDCWADLAPLMENTDELGGFQFLEVRSTLPDELLMYADKLSMAHSLEVRVPYLDRELVEWVQRLDAGFKVRNGKGKWLHRQVCRGFLPESILKRKKRGFAVNVVDDWFHDSMKGRFGDLLLDSGSMIFSLLQQSSVTNLLRGHQSGAKDNHKILFSLVALEEWLRSVHLADYGQKAVA
ncbi:MAG: asparagine synthase (glutamine-hydrolyzing) [Syntrophobacteraceae bacterium]|nr:asparagine synthase (glutamine-hydrolyzing) [Syntrophobacteraceae bacterium]